MPEGKTPMSVKPEDQFIELEVCRGSHDRSERSGKMITFRHSDLVAISGFLDSSKPGRIHLRSGSRYDVTETYDNLDLIMRNQQCDSGSEG